MQFDLPDDPGGHDRVNILHGHDVLFTASQRSGLYFLDSLKHVCTANADAASTRDFI